MSFLPPVADIQCDRRPPDEVSVRGGRAGADLLAHGAPTDEGRPGLYIESY